MTSDKRDAAGDTSAARQLILGYQASRALLAADELGLTDLLEDGAKTVQELAHATGTHAQTLYRFLRALAAIDLIREKTEGYFSLGPLAPGLHNAARIGVENYKAWTELPYSLRTGKPAFDKVHGNDFYTYLADDPSRAARFDSALAALSRDWVPAMFDVYDFPGTGTVADIGGGRGTFIAELLKAQPDLHGILFDQPDVVKHAIPLLEQAGVSERCRIVGGNFFESIPSGANIYTLCNLLVDWDDKEGADILRNCHEAMNVGSRILIMDRVLPAADNPNRQTMVFLDLFFLVLKGGRIRTRQEFEQLMESTGFRVKQVLSTASTFSVIEGIKA